MKLDSQTLAAPDRHHRRGSGTSHTRRQQQLEATSQLESVAGTSTRKKVVGRCRIDSSSIANEPMLTQEGVERLWAKGLLHTFKERVFCKDKEGRFLLVSTGFAAALGEGLTVDEIIGKTDFDFLDGVYAASAREDELSVMESGEAILNKVEEQFFPNSPDIWVAVNKWPFCNEEKKIIGVWGLVRDATAQVAAEAELAASREALIASERQHRILFERNPQPVLVYDAKTLEILAASDIAVANYGYSREELLKMSVLDLRPLEDAEYFRTYLATHSGHGG